MYTLDIKPTDRDIWEFNAWKNEKRTKPRLLSQFKDESEYEDFIRRWQSENLTIKDDPAILNNPSKVNDSERQDQFGSRDGDSNLYYKFKFPKNESFSKDDNKIQFIDGSWRILKSGGELWPQKYDSRESAKANLRNSRLHREYHKDGSETRIFKGFGFDNVEDAGAGTITHGSVIGTLTMSQSYVHLFHFTTYGQLPAHLALDNFYEKIGKKVDALAEHILAFNEVDQFNNVVLPGTCPLNYLIRLHTFCDRAKSELFSGLVSSGYASQLDDISNEISESIYRLKRLKVGYKWFTEEKDSPDSYKNFSEIDSDDSFRKYAHSIMQKAHADNYSEEHTDKVVNDLLKSPHEDYGELIGRLTSGLGN